MAGLPAAAAEERRIGVVGAEDPPAPKDVLRPSPTASPGATPSSISALLTLKLLRLDAGLLFPLPLLATPCVPGVDPLPLLARAPGTIAAAEDEAPPTARDKVGRPEEEEVVR